MVYNIGVIFTRDGNRIVMSLLTLSSSVVKGWIIKRVWGTNAGKRLNAIAMWIGHYAASLALKPFAPGVPLSLLSLAGALPDASFFILNFLGIESFSVYPTYAKCGCFLYSTNNPDSHSLVGMGVMGGFSLNSVYPSGIKLHLSQLA